MKWLKRISIVVGALIVISIIASIVTTNILNNRITAAQENGSQEGHAQGYVVGHQEGSTVGYQEGNKAGYQAGSKVGYQEGEEEGYNSGYKIGFDDGIGTGYIVRNPTYNEVQEFLADEETTSPWGINNFAENKGIQAAYVEYETPHIIVERKVYVLVAFDTIDKGLIFIESSSHKEIKVEIGKRYSELNGYPIPDYDDTITKITIIW